MSRIVIDARRMNSSTGHYSERLLHHLQSIDHDNEYIVVLLEKEKAIFTPSAANFSLVTTTADHYTFAEQLRYAWFLRSLQPDLVHFCMPQQPLLWFGKRVTTVHDTTLIHFENLDQNIVIYKARQFIFTQLLRNVIRRSKAVIVPTTYVHNDLDSWTRQKYSPKFMVTHESGDLIHAEPQPIAELEGQRFLFWIGNAFPYKNIARIVEAFAKLKATYPDLHLALAGKKDYFYEMIQQDITKRGIPDVHILGYISEGQKRWAMQQATSYVCASLSEGFHIPLLEAMHEGCPVITSNATCLPEVAGDAALYFNPHSSDELVAAVTQLLTIPGLRDELIDKGHANTKRFSWRKMAEETHQTYRSVLANSQ